MRLIKRSMLVLLFLPLSLGVLSSQPVLAAPYCREVASHEICILRITRSAKNYWEYRASVSIDRQKPVAAVYNCRVGLSGQNPDRRSEHANSQQNDQTHDSTTSEISATEVRNLICNLVTR